MKVYAIILVIIAETSIIHEVFADCTHVNPCYTWNPGVENNCGQGCTYTYENGTTYIKSAGNNPRIRDYIFFSSAYDTNSKPPSIHNVVIDGPISIGSNAYTTGTFTVSGRDGTLVLNSVGHHGFGDYTTLTGNIVIPANARFGSLAFHGVTLAEGAKIYCAVENCAQKMIDSCNAYGDETNEYRVRCLNAAQTIISDEDKFEQAPEGCDFWSSEGCSKCTNSNYSLEYGYCYRKRYTLPEADAATSNDNENMIEWIFE